MPSFKIVSVLEQPVWGRVCNRCKKAKSTKRVYIEIDSKKTMQSDLCESCMKSFKEVANEG